MLVEGNREDAKLKTMLDADLLKKRQEQHKAFEAFLRIKAKEYADMRPKRIELRGGAESDDEDAYTLVEEEEREEIEMTEEVIFSDEQPSPPQSEPSPHTPRPIGVARVAGN